MLFNSAQKVLHIHTWERASFNITIVLFVDDIMRLQLSKQSQKLPDMPHYAEDSRSCRSLCTTADGKVARSGMHCSSLTHPRFRCSRPPLTAILSHSQRVYLLRIYRTARALPVATVLFSRLGFMKCYGAHI